MQFWFYFVNVKLPKFYIRKMCLPITMYHTLTVKATHHLFFEDGSPVSTDVRMYKLEFRFDDSEAHGKTRVNRAGEPDIIKIVCCDPAYPVDSDCEWLKKSIETTIQTIQY